MFLSAFEQWKNSTWTRIIFTITPEGIKRFCTERSFFHTLWPHLCCHSLRAASLEAEANCLNPEEPAPGGQEEGGPWVAGAVQGPSQTLPPNLILCSPAPGTILACKPPSHYSSQLAFCSTKNMASGEFLLCLIYRFSTHLLIMGKKRATTGI